MTSFIEAARFTIRRIPGTGKALSGLIDYVKQGRFPAGSTILFIHTGGTPALFAYHNEFVDIGGYQDHIVP